MLLNASTKEECRLIYRRQSIGKYSGTEGYPVRVVNRQQRARRPVLVPVPSRLVVRS